MFNWLLSKQQQRKRALAKAPAGVMRDYLNTPFPAKKSPCSELEIVSLDLETTGLKPRRDAILSIGLVAIRARQIHLDSAWQRVIRIEQPVPEASAVIHRITDDHAAAGIPLEQALPQLLERLSGRVMLVHYKSIEQGFLDAACRRLYGVPFIIPIIDTLELAQRLFTQRNHSIQSGDLRLFNLRPRYNLPHYRAHNALSDALATAELFLAMAAEMAPKPSQCRLDRFQTD